MEGEGGKGGVQEASVAVDTADAVGEPTNGNAASENVDAEAPASDAASSTTPTTMATPTTKKKLDVKVVQNLRKVHQENEWTGDDVADVQEVEGEEDDDELEKGEGEEEEDEERDSDGREAKRVRLADESEVDDENKD